MHVCARTATHLCCFCESGWCYLSMFYCCQAVLPRSIRRCSGRLLNWGSRSVAFQLLFHSHTTFNTSVFLWYAGFAIWEACSIVRKLWYDPAFHSNQLPVIFNPPNANSGPEYKWTTRRKVPCQVSGVFGLLRGDYKDNGPGFTQH